jgi:hypothetical protein
MDRGTFLAYCLIGMAAALVVIIPLKAKRRASIPAFVWWLCVILGAAACGYGLFQSTTPSFATRITAVGRTYDSAEHSQGRSTSYFSFRLVPDSGQPVDIETRLIIPSWGNPSIFNGRTFRVVYLDENNRGLKNEAIDIEILSGQHAGFHDTLDARPFGKWLGIPLGAAVGFFGFFGLKYRNDDALSVALDNDPAGYAASLPNYTEQQKLAFKEQFSVIKKRQYMGAAPIIATLIPALVGEVRNWQGSIVGLPYSVFALAFPITVFSVLAFSFWNWRCPACNRYLGSGGGLQGPTSCPNCGVALQ